MLISGVFLLILMQLGAPAPDSLRDLVRVALEENRDIQAAARR